MVVLCQGQILQQVVYVGFISVLHLYLPMLLYFWGVMNASRPRKQGQQKGNLLALS